MIFLFLMKPLFFRKESVCYKYRLVFILQVLLLSHLCSFMKRISRHDTHSLFTLLYFPILSMHLSILKLCDI